MRESEGKVEILGTRGPVIDENLVRAQGTCKAGSRAGAMGGAADRLGQVESSTCGLESCGIQRVRFRMQEWGRGRVGQKALLG